MALTNTLLDFAAANPIPAFFLAWPLVFLLIAETWIVAALVECALNLLLRFGNLVTIWARGYPPVATPPVPADVTEKPTDI